jgi:hypothetical protein
MEKTWPVKAVVFIKEFYLKVRNSGTVCPFTESFLSLSGPVCRRLVCSDCVYVLRVGEKPGCLC